MDRDKKRAAAVSAEMAHPRKEEEEPRQPTAPMAAAGTINLWGISGRQAQMQLRNLMQLKAFHLLRLR